MKKIILILIVGIIFSSCAKNESSELISEDQDNSYTGELKLAPDMRTLYVIWDTWLNRIAYIFCAWPAGNCLPTYTVVGTAEDEITYQYNDFITAIENDGIQSFFGTNSNWDDLFPFLADSSNSGFLSALQNDDLKIVEMYYRNDEIFYYAAIPSSTSSTTFTEEDVVVAFAIDLIE